MWMVRCGRLDCKFKRTARDHYEAKEIAKEHGDATEHRNTAVSLGATLPR